MPELLSRARSVMAIPWVDGEVYDVIRDLVGEVEQLRVENGRLRADVAAASAEIANVTAEAECLREYVSLL